MTSTPKARLLINGARGKMGARIAALAREDARFTVVAECDVHDIAAADALPRGACDVIIDFSSEQGSLHALELAQKHGAALMVGTTGLSRTALDRIKAASKSCAIMIAPNTSRGVAVLSHLITEAARLLGPDFNIDMVESHHTMKKDAPSGTALRLAAAVRDGGGADFADSKIHSIRAGDIIGEHTIQFAGPGERIIITHTATNRDLFARGALHAAAWLRGKPPGMHTIEQSLGMD